MILRRVCGQARLPPEFRERILSALLAAAPGALSGGELAARVLWPCAVTALLWWRVLALADDMAHRGAIWRVRGDRALAYALGRATSTLPTE